MDNQNWSLQQVIYRATHQWQVLMALGLVGALLGAMIAWVAPTPYQAVRQLYVAVNMNGVYRNPDDYKNSLLTSLRDLAFTRDVLKPVLTSLREQDPAWNTVSIEDFEEMLQAQWRTAGIWDFVARAPTAAMADQAADAWSATVFEVVQTALIQALVLQQVQTDLYLVSEQKAALTAYQSRLEEVQTRLTLERVNLLTLRQEALELNSRWQLMALVSQATGFDQLWQTLLEQMPDPQAPASDYIPWINQVLTSIETELVLLPGKLADVQNQRQELATDYLQALKRSRGLTVDLYVEEATQAGHAAQAVRPLGALVLTGGILGLLAGLVWVLARLHLRIEG
jgi:hypothetical protein